MTQLKVGDYVKLIKPLTSPCIYTVLEIGPFYVNLKGAKGFTYRIIDKTCVEILEPQDLKCLK
jgi:hypothetical protein